MNAKTESWPTPSEPSIESFAEFVRILGRGKRGARSLTEYEAQAAMRQILAARAAPEQIGAFLMLLRVKEETPEELAGFVRAARETLQPPAHLPAVAVDWPAYAGKRRHLPWYLLAARCLAERGWPVFMHGAGGGTDRLHAERTLPLLDLPVCRDWSQAAEALQRHRFAYLPLQAFAPRLLEVLELRALLGLRSPVHTLVRLLNPAGAACSIQGIFHPPYAALHRDTARLLNEPATVLAFKGEGGEAERNPERPCTVLGWEQGAEIDREWPAMLPPGARKPEILEPEHLLAVWRGERRDEYGEAAVQGTLALVINALGLANSADEAHRIARRWWDTRQTPDNPHVR